MDKSFLEIAKQKNRIRELDEVFKEFPPEEEWHKGKIKNVLEEEREQYSYYKIGDIEIGRVSCAFYKNKLVAISFNGSDEILDHYLSQEKPALSTLVPVEIFEKYGVNYSYEFNGKVPSGINILRSENVVQDEELLIISRYELIFNVNTIETAILTNKFL